MTATLPMFPLGIVLFPSMLLPLHVFEPRYRKLTADCLGGDGRFGVTLIERGSEVGGGDQRAMVGAVARIELASPFPDGRWALIARGGARVRVERWLPDDPYPRAEVEELPTQTATGLDDLVEAARASVRRARALLSELGADAGAGAPEEIDVDPDVEVWRLSALAPLGPFDRQRLLECDDPARRLHLLEALCHAAGDDAERLLRGG